MVVRARRREAARGKPKTRPAAMVAQPLANAPFFPWDGGPFTPEGVFTLIRDEVLKGDAILPSSADHAITIMTHALNLFWWKVKGWTGPWREEQEQLQRIGEAIRVLTEVLPEKRKAYVSAAAMMERWDDKATAAARADLAAFDALVATARGARKRGLPLALNMMLVTSKPAKRWKDFAEDLQTIFHHALPGRSKASAYRFIVAVTPIITGEHPSFQAVETPLKRRRFVNGGNRTE